jgi:hypothetical protein
MNECALVERQVHGFQLLKKKNLFKHLHRKFNKKKYKNIRKNYKFLLMRDYQSTHFTPSLHMYST